MRDVHMHVCWSVSQMTPGVCVCLCSVHMCVCVCVYMCLCVHMCVCAECTMRWVGTSLKSTVKSDTGEWDTTLHLNEGNEGCEREYLLFFAVKKVSCLRLT